MTFTPIPEVPAVDRRWQVQIQRSAVDSVDWYLRLYPVYETGTWDTAAGWYSTVPLTITAFDEAWWSAIEGGPNTFRTPTWAGSPTLDTVIELILGTITYEVERAGSFASWKANQREYNLRSSEFWTEWARPDIEPWRVYDGPLEAARAGENPADGGADDPALNALVDQAHEESTLGLGSW